MKKVQYITNLRILACIGVVLCHVSAMNWYGMIYSNSWLVFTIYEGISRFCVPAFVMISGKLFLDKKKKISTKKLYCQNIWKLIIFLWIWGIMYQIYEQKSLSQIIMNMLECKVQAHLWYIYLAIGLYIATPIIKVWVNAASKKQIEYFLLLCLIFNSIPTLLEGFDFPMFVIVSTVLKKCSVNIVSGYIGYFVLGYYLDEYELSKRIRRFIYTGGIGLLILCLALTIGFSRYTGKPEECFWNYNGIFIIGWSVCVYVFVKYNMDKITKSYTDKISKCTLGIYAVHMFVVFGLSHVGLNTMSFNSVISVPLITILVFSLSYFTIELLRKIPIM